METTIIGKTKSPYADDSINKIYELLFCDDMELYKRKNKQLALYPADILFSPGINIRGLQKITNDADVETRYKILAWRRLASAGVDIVKKELLGVIVEVGLDGGLDVVASYKDGSARYINQTGKIIIWDTSNAVSDELTKDLFQKSAAIVAQIDPWDGQRRPFPKAGMVRISFLASDGPYFGEGPSHLFFNDPLAKPALLSAAALMQFLTDKVLGDNRK